MSRLPEALARNRGRTFSTELTLDVLKQIGIAKLRVIVLPHELLWTADHCYLEDGLLLETWRSADSFVATTSNAKLKTDPFVLLCEPRKCATVSPPSSIH